MNKTIPLERRRGALSPHCRRPILVAGAGRFRLCIALLTAANAFGIRSKIYVEIYNSTGNLMLKKMRKLAGNILSYDIRVRKHNFDWNASHVGCSPPQPEDILL